MVSDVNLIPNTKELEFFRGMADYKSTYQMNLYLCIFFLSYKIGMFSEKNGSMLQACWRSYFLSHQISNLFLIPLKSLMKKYVSFYTHSIYVYHSDTSFSKLVWCLLENVNKEIYLFFQHC